MSASFVVIGNEILSGKISESNVEALARALRGIGIPLARVTIIPDDVDTIAEEIERQSGRYRYVFTSGGVGPTHDDVTIAGIAKAFDVPVVRDEELVAILRHHYREKLHENHLLLANVPEGAEKLYTEKSPWPLTRFRNVFILPGVPEIFRAKLDIVREHLPRRTPFVSRAVFTKLDEALLKPLLDDVVGRFPTVELGSYPRFKDPRYETKVTFDGRDATLVDKAFEAFLALLPEGEPQWTE